MGSNITRPADPIYSDITEAEVQVSNKQILERMKFIEHMLTVINRKLGFIQQDIRRFNAVVEEQRCHVVHRIMVDNSTDYMPMDRPNLYENMASESPYDVPRNQR